ncbi:toxin-antitoxin system HicB family antitoxin [Streptomyces goshikiensis]|uniref:toxin-antitoxin system HicB family antitoxin n=1 Tax=Streptomyces goshikiensis TaxID=1942 RepID=UPI00369D0B9E
MPSLVVAARVSPYLHARLTERAAERGTSLSAYAAEALAAVVENPETGGPRLDGPLVAAVLRAIDSAPDGQEDEDAGELSTRQVHRELCLLLARVVDRREPGYLSAIGPLRRALDAALPRKGDPTMTALLATLFRP